MPTIIFKDYKGVERPVKADSGSSLMETAVSNGIVGVDAECGGACACATCHVYIHVDYVNKVGVSGEMEQSMLDFAEGVLENSRLSCQIIVTDDLDGMVVTTPESQS